MNTLEQAIAKSRARKADHDAMRILIQAAVEADGEGWEILTSAYAYLAAKYSKARS